MSPILQYWLNKQANQVSPFLPKGSLIAKPANVIMPGGLALNPNGLQPSRTVGEQLPAPTPKPMKLPTATTNPLAIV